MDASLPIYSCLPALKAALATQRTVILQAAPGAGKSTVLPLALLDEPWLAGQRMVMLEPRRLAARAVATRMATQRGEQPGQTVGYQVRFENRIGPRTRIEVVTEGILTRRMQNDTALDGVSLIIFDEFHERGLHADLALALCREIQQQLRDDLRVLIMSATLDSEALRSVLGDVPVISAESRQYPIETIYAERDSDAPIPALAVAGITRALTEQRGDVLAFLPGAGEINRTEEMLRERHPDILVHALYGDLPLDAQQAAITPDARGRRKIVLATSIAETSLTIEGVRIVVDCGYARVPRFDSSTGLTRLETVRLTRDSADQRAGRAGRLGPGFAYRMWSRETQQRLNAVRKPEILEADLAPLRLEIAQWGVRDALALGWITPPPPGALRQATELLESLGALREGALTQRGRLLLDWPTHPRLAHMLQEARDSGERRAPALAADIAAVMDERDPLPRGSGADISLRIDALRDWRATQRRTHGADARGLARIEKLAAQWRQQLGAQRDNAPVDPNEIGRWLMQAYPDRIAQARDNHSGRYKLANGRGVQLAVGDALIHAPLLVVAQLDGGTGAEGRVYLAAPLSIDDALSVARETDVVGWDAKLGLLVARREQRIGEIALSTKPLSKPPLEARVAALCGAIQSEGLALLNWTDAAQQLQARVHTVRLWRGADWPDFSDEALLTGVADWLPPWLERVSKRGDFARLDVHAMLLATLPYDKQRALDALAPTHLEVPSGSHIRLTYTADGAPPVLAVKLQEMFGLADTPTVNEGRSKVMLHLLSPAQRPIQVTQDLRSFWANTYPDVRKELRGRYNKHPWPEDPWNAPPTRRTVRASNRG